MCPSEQLEIDLQCNQNPKAKFGQLFGSSELGKGSYGVVFRANGFAYKKVDSQCQGISQTTLREVAVMRELCHINVLRLKAVYKFPIEPEFVYLQMDLAETDLRRYLEINGPPTFDRIKDWSFQILQGIDYCHCLQIIHRDLKPANILLMKYPHHYPEEYYLKIADWGICRQIALPIKNYTTEIQTLLYRAPEIVFNGKSDTCEYGPEVDIWSAGLIIIELILGKPFFDCSTELQLLQEWRKKLGWPSQALFPESSINLSKYRSTQNDLSIICNHRPDINHAQRVSVTTLLKDHMLEWDPRKRNTANECLMTDFFNDVYDMDQVKYLYESIAVEMEEQSSWSFAFHKQRRDAVMNLKAKKYPNCINNDKQMMRYLPTPPVEESLAPMAIY